MNPLNRLRALLEEGVSEGVFPAAQAVVRLDGDELFSAAVGGVSEKSHFDLSSLTKVLGTSALFMKLWASGALSPQSALSEFLPDAAVARAGATLEDLLFHRSGLPAFAPLFADVLRRRPELLDPSCPPELRLLARREVIAATAATAPLLPAGSAAAYSDLGFILLGEALAEAAGCALDDAIGVRIANPLGLSARFHRLSRFSPEYAADVAPTGRFRPREPAPGQEGLWSLPGPPHASRPGEVDDDNAFVLDGVAGHAGLFGTARDVARFGQAVLSDLSGRTTLLAPAALWERALTLDPVTPLSLRTLGFDTPSPESSAGRFLGDSAPGAFGHLGFTGTSLWVDRPRQLVVALVTNRTYNGRGNLRIRDFRPRFHDAVVQALALETPHA